MRELQHATTALGSLIIADLEETRNPEFSHLDHPQGGAEGNELSPPILGSAPSTSPGTVMPL